MKATPDPNGWHIEVYPRSAGDFGFASMSGIRRDAREAGYMQREMQEQIERHVDNLPSRGARTQVVYDSWSCGECGYSFSTKSLADECCDDGCDDEEVLR
jgi:rubrerythrin